MTIAFPLMTQDYPEYSHPATVPTKSMLAPLLSLQKCPHMDSVCFSVKRNKKEITKFSQKIGICCQGKLPLILEKNLIADQLTMQTSKQKRLRIIFLTSVG